MCLLSIRIRQAVSTSFGLSIFFGSVLVLSVPAARAAGTAGDIMSQLGQRACHQVLDGGSRNILGRIDYRAAVEKAGIDRSMFCTCVGMVFEHNGPEQSARMENAGNEAARTKVFADILTENINTCLDPKSFLYEGDFYGEALEPEECQDGCQDGPIWKEEADQLQCEFAIDGTLTPPVFQPEETLAWIRNSGISAKDLCGCAARVMEDKADEYAAERKENGDDPATYWDYMDQSVSQCRMAMWNG